MPSYRTGEVVRVLSSRPGLQRLLVRMPDDPRARAYCLTALVGEVGPGDAVVCNTTAVDLGLGSGGWHVVHWNLSRRELTESGPDHVMKLRYTSLQADVGTSELVHPGGTDAPLGDVAVVACTVHSQLPAVVAGVRHVVPDARIGYVMTDGAALPFALSDLAADMCSRGLLVGSVTAGQAFGGDLEAVGIPSALGLARHVLRSDVVVVAMGPGVVGTSTAMGSTALEAAWVLQVTRARGGLPVLCVRASDADARERHRGVSHHSTTVLELAASRPLVADADGLDRVHPAFASTELVRADPLPDAAELLAGEGLDVTTMGRTPVEDRLFFTEAVAAGTVAGSLVQRGGP